MGVIKLASSVSAYIALASVAGAGNSLKFTFFLFLLFYSWKYMLEIFTGQVFAKTSGRARGMTILLGLSLLFFVVIVLFVWMSAESEKNGNGYSTPRDNPAAMK